MAAYRLDLMTQDHPRIRGEHLMKYGLVMEAAGSSPHTRGARRARQWDLDPEKDHPRIRGEHVGLGFRVAVGDGSSPHTRGAPARRMDHLLLERDHPRIRGEHSHECELPDSHFGSSPHTRGAQMPLRPDRVDRGIIPAYAGSTRRSWRPG